MVTAAKAAGCRFVLSFCYNPTMKIKKKNPFYALLVLVGVAFVLTASAYGVMTVRGTDRSASSVPQTGILGFMDRHGNWILTVEVLLLGLLTVAAMGTDQLDIPVDRNKPVKKPQIPDTNHSQKGTET